MLKKLALVLVAAMVLTTIAAAQTLDVYWVNYFTNRNNPTGADQFVNIINPGLQGSPLQTTAPAEGTLCANIYVFDAVQEMIECCACPITANALLSLSVNSSLTANPLTSVAPATGVIKLVSTLPNGTACDPTHAGTLTPDLRSWGTHLQQPTAGNFASTEGFFQDAPLGATEAAFLPQACLFAQYLGTGKAVCACK
jgi:hypothetical protein